MPIQLKRYGTSYYVDQNYVPLNGEVCLEEVSSGVYKFKVGDPYGTAWNSLYYPVVFTVGNNSFSGVQNFSSGIISNASLRNYSEQVVESPLVNSGLSIDLSSGNIYKTTLNTNITGVFITGLRPSGTMHSFTLIFDYISSGRAVTWPSSVYWNGGSGAAPVLSSGVGRSAVFSFATVNGGSSYLGFVGGTNFGV